MATLPSEFKIAQAQITSNLPITETDSRSLIRIQRKTGGHRWEMTLTSTRLNLEDMKPITAAIGAIRNAMDTVELAVPVYSESLASTQTASLNRPIGVTSATVTSTTNVAAGDYFRFSGHSKIYVVTSVTSGTTFNFFPSLQKAVTAGQTLTFDGVQFTMRLSGDPLSFTASNDNTAVIELDLVEAL
jgi:hypothetical protein